MPGRKKNSTGFAIVTVANKPEHTVPLKGKKGLIVGIANRKSIAYGCADVLRSAGAELAVTYLNAQAEPFVRPLAEQFGSPIVVPCDVREPGQLEAVFSHIRREWGRLDFLLHSIAYAPKEDLHSRIVDCSQAGFAMAMDVSCHSFIRMARLAEPLMTDGGCLLTVTFYGAEKVVEEYNNGSASMRCLPVRSRRAQHRVSNVSTNSWSGLAIARPSTSS
jgi:enoyl-[acyl-carrier protein] reductase I